MTIYSTSREIIPALNRKGYKVFSPLILNLVGVRSEKKVLNEFNDLLYVFWKSLGVGGTWTTEVFPITTLPGRYWLVNFLLNRKGSLIVAPGQYLNAYQIGQHKGYEALVQRKPMRVYRDKNQNENFDFDDSTIESGYFGANIHRSNKEGVTAKIDKWSAGCQAFKNANDFYDFMDLCKLTAKTYGNNFTYTLLDERDI